MTAPAARSAVPPDALVARFGEALARLWPEGGTLGLAVSGGPDSLALLLLAQAALPGRIEVATVDHGLRAASADECALVSRACAERGIPCAVLTVKVASGNLQDAARTARYAALAQWARARGLGAIATAHHADDQAETLLMRLNRGSGVAGLAGVRARGTVPGSEIALLRPLLGFRREELAALVKAAGIAAAADPGNADPRFDRVRMRQALAGADWLDAAALAASAQHISDANEALDWAVQVFRNSYCQVSEGEIRCRRHAPRAIALRIAAWAIETLGRPARGADLARLLDRLAAGEGGNLGGVLVRPEGAEWVFRAEPARRPA